MSEKHYKAFISYSHQDEKFGTWLHKKLETYKIPKQLREDYPHLPEKLFPLFRDREELSTSPSLGKKILKALQNSEYLIIVCSQNSAKSQWVNKEIIDFKKIHGEDKVHAIIIDGEPHAKESDKFSDELECFPEALKYEVIDGKLSSKPTEPIAGDFRNGKDGKEYGKLKLIAGLLGVEFDELNQRENQRRRKKRLIRSFLVFLLLIVMTGLTLFSFQQMNRATQAEEVALKEKALAEKQLIIATNKKQSLSILTTRTLEALMLTDETILETYLKSVLNSGEREVFIEMLRPLIKETESMDNEEKQYLFDILPGMNEKQISKLVRILMVESQKLYNLELKYQKEIKQLHEKHLKERRNSLKKKCFNENKKENCLIAIDELLDSSVENNESIIDYFRHYKKLEKNPSAHYYNLYGKFLNKKNKKKEALIYLNKAISIDSNNIDYLKDLVLYHKEEKNTTKALELVEKVIFYRENKLSILRDGNKTKYTDTKKELLKDIKLLLSLYYSENSINEIIQSYLKFEKLITSMKDEEVNVYLTIEAYLSSGYGNLKQYDKAIEHLKKIMATYSQYGNKVNKVWIAEKYLLLSWYQLLIGKYNQTIHSSKKGIDLDKNLKMSLETNLAHAYLLSGDFEKAKFIYMKNKKKKFINGKLWEEVIIKDFETLRKEDVQSNDFEKIEKLFKENN
jgi:tetratricopeptide (TPR) repeat protein